MKKSVFFKILFLMVVIAAGFSQNADAQGRRALSEAQRISGDRFNFAVRTRLGAVVYSVNRPSPQVMNAIDQGLSDLFAAARRNGYSRRLNHSSYAVFIGRADRTRSASGAYSPDIAVGAAQYAGSEYDQGGFIYAAGIVLDFDSGAFLIAEHDRDFGRVANAVRYEGEHIVLYHNDRRRFQATADHSAGGSHPIIQ